MENVPIARLEVRADVELGTTLTYSYINYAGLKLPVYADKRTYVCK